MVIQFQSNKRQRGWLMADMMVALAILAIAILPLSYTALSDSREFRATYQQAIATEIVDGEMEILAAGTWRNYPEGTNAYPVQANALTNLPPGKFQFTRTTKLLRLEWLPAKKHGLGRIYREATLK